MTSIESTFGIGRLIAKHLTDALDAGEQVQLDAWLKDDEKHTAIFNRIVAHESLAAALVEMQQVNTELALANVKSRISTLAERKSLRLWPRIAVAAAAVAAITLGVWFYTSRQSRLVGNPGSAQYANDIAPGKNGATITLGNGKVIELSDAKSGVVVGKDLKYDDGSDVRYSSGTSSSGSLKGSQNSSGPVGVHSLPPNNMMLTASTARGQTYQFTLPDGTKVWLNADSKISFPSQFSGQDRKILLSGEAYFEVSKHIRKPTKPIDKGTLPREKNGMERVPFIVETDQQIVEVLGTHFNVNSYMDEGSTKTTLLEGSVRVLYPAKGPAVPTFYRDDIVLKPNQQVTLYDGEIKVKQVDTEEAISWKNGFFVFNKTRLDVIMHQLERWYNIQVVYEDEAARQQTLSGSASRYDKVSRILKTIENTGAVKFKIGEGKITVMK